MECYQTADAMIAPNGRRLALINAPTPDTQPGGMEISTPYLWGKE